MMKFSIIISPHLSIYKPQYNSVFSILFRVSGIYLFVLGLFYMVQLPFFILSEPLIDWSYYFLFYISLLFFQYHIVISFFATNWKFIRPVDYFVLDDFDILQGSNLILFQCLLLIFLIGFVFFIISM